MRMKIISISTTEHLTSMIQRPGGKLGIGLLVTSCVVSIKHGLRTRNTTRTKYKCGRQTTLLKTVLTDPR